MPKRLPSRYLYDDEGSRLFAKIMETDDYYPTACEFEILRTQGSQIIAHLMGRPINVVDLGAGNGEKTMVLLEQMRAAGMDIQYVPIDISEGALRVVTEKVGQALPDLEVSGLVAEYYDAMHWIGQELSGRTNLVLFLGSNLGNFTRVQSRRFLRQLWNLLQTGDFLFTGFDLKKDIEVLLAAYNDRNGVTRAFNSNLLTRINRELGATFDVSNFRHFGTYDVLEGAMKSYLVSQCAQAVYIAALEHSFEFRAWEPIHTEYSYKYLEEDVDDLADTTGFEVCGHFHDSRRYFMDSLWKVRHRNVVPPGRP